MSIFQQISNLIVSKMKYSNIENSIISNYKLIDPTVKIKNSNLDGNVKVYQNSNITNSNINGNINIGRNSSVDGANLNGKIILGENAIISNACLSWNIKIGNHTSIFGPNIDIYSIINNVIIGNYVSIARNVSIQEYSHFVDRCSTYFVNSHIFEKEWTKDIFSKGDILIGNDVWIGAHSVILSGVNIGDGAIVGANSVVTKDIPPYAIVAGVPATIIKYRFSKEIISKLLEIKWWDWPKDKIKSNYELFDGKLTLDKLNNLKI